MALKQVTVWGKTPEELQQMDFKEFLKLLPARQRRSLTRGQSEGHKKVLAAIRRKDGDIKTHERDMVIVPDMIGAQIKVYNGKEWIALAIDAEMVGHFLGEFSQTRRKVQHSAPGIGATRSSAALSVR